MGMQGAGRAEESSRGRDVGILASWGVCFTGFMGWVLVLHSVQRRGGGGLGLKGLESNLLS